MQNPGADGIDGTPDDVLAPLNEHPVSTSMDVSPFSGCRDNNDRVQNFSSAHAGGGFFLLGDGSVQWVSDSIDTIVYQDMSTIRTRRRPGP